VAEPGVLILAGPTASGKTEAAIDLAVRFGAEIIGADSRQIYRGMPIGTAAPTPQQQARIPHHLVEFLDPGERYSAARFTSEAVGAIRELHRRGRRAIVVGGTGFYIRALTGDVELAPQYDEAVRDRLAREARMHPPDVLYEWLRVRDSRRAEALDANDTYRVMRALEVSLLGPKPELLTGRENLRTAGIPFQKLFLDVPLEENDERIERRTDVMLEAGLLEEADRVGPGAVAASAVGYPQAFAYLDGWSSFDELRASLARATRRYARRQRAWFRSEPNTLWVGRDRLERVAREILGWT